jgi:hypothetical protein
MALNSLPPSLTYTHLCPDCLIATMEKLGPPYQRDATVVRLRVEITAQLPKTGSDSSSGDRVMSSGIKSHEGAAASVSSDIFRYSAALIWAKSTICTLTE